MLLHQLLVVLSSLGKNFLCLLRVLEWYVSLGPFEVISLYRIAASKSTCWAFCVDKVAASFSFSFFLSFFLSFLSLVVMVLWTDKAT